MSFCYFYNMKIWFLADTHLGMKGDNEDILIDCFNYYNDILIPYMRKNVKKDDILVHLGDVFDNRSIIGIHTIYCVIKIFEQLSEIFGDIRVCVGNHDMMQKTSTEITALHSIKYIPNVKIYFQPTYENICGKKVLFMPWIEDLTKQKEQITNSNVDYIFGHLQIGGSVGAKGIKINGDNMVQPKDFKKAQVFAGHIHIRQDFKNVHYVGNPYHKDKGDIGNVKGITVLDIENGETTFIENTYSPKYIKENIYNILNDTVGKIKKRWKNNYVDVEINSSDIANFDYQALRDALDNCFKELKICPINTEGVIKVNEEKIRSEAKSSGDILNDYIDETDIDDEMKTKIKDYIDKFKSKL